MKNSFRFQMVHVPLPCQCEFTGAYITEATTPQAGSFCHDTCCLEFRQKALENARLQGEVRPEKNLHGHFTDTMES